VVGETREETDVKGNERCHEKEQVCRWLGRRLEEEQM
jgi:hypothetical protein